MTHGVVKGSGASQAARMHRDRTLLTSSLRALGAWGSKPAAAVIGAGTISFCYAWSVLSKAAGYQPSADSHYHFTVARSMLHHGPWPSPAAGLPWTLFAQMPVDHYWAFHVLLVPFAAIPNYVLGLKLAAGVGYSLVFAALAAFMSRRQVTHPIVWALICGLFSNQDWRYLQLRGAQLLLPLMLVLVELIAFRAASRRRNALLVATVWLATLGYHGAAILLPIACTAALAAHISDEGPSHFRGWLTAAARDVGLTVIGLLLGLVVNPYADRRGSTFRFFAYHLWKMGRDSNNLYADQAQAEFHGMPFSTIVWFPEWGLLLLATLGSLLWMGTRFIRRLPPLREANILGALALLGIVLVAQAVRTREYAVPLAVALLAVLWGRRAPPQRWVGPLTVAGACVALALKVPTTVALARQHLPTDMYRGAQGLLVANGSSPVLNLAEADFGMLRIQYPDVVCAQALSRYFLLPHRDVYDDLWYLYRSPGDSEARTGQTLERFYARGVHIVATHGNRPLDGWAKTHSDWLKVVFRSPVSAARLYKLSIPTGDSPAP